MFSFSDFSYPQWLRELPKTNPYDGSSSKNSKIQISSKKRLRAIKKRITQRESRRKNRK